MTTLRTIVTNYFEEHPDSRDDVLKAWYAYHAPHFRVMPDSPLHNFTSSLRESKCVWCGRSREMVRHDEESGRCSKRPGLREIKDVLQEESLKSFALQERAKIEVPKLVEKRGMSGETLAVLHHTYGHDPETVAGVVDVPSQMLAGYQAVMEAETERSRAGQKRTVVTAQGLTTA